MLVCSGGLGKQDFGPPSSPLVKIPILLTHREFVFYFVSVFLSSARLLSLAYFTRQYFTQSAEFYHVH